MKEKLNNIFKNYIDKIKSAKSLKELDGIFLELLGKNGEITLFPKNFASLPKEELKIVSPLFNKIKSELEKEIDKRRKDIREEKYSALTSDEIDISKPAQIILNKGHLHPTTQFIQETIKVFAELGFQQFDAPEIDSDYYNFEVLNIPQNHPARDLWDTLYTNQADSKQPGKNLLLRTHTSNAQVRIMKQFKPPFRMMSIGRCYRYENVDARHEHTFTQFELIYVDKGLNMANLQYLSEYFLKKTVGEDIKARLRPKYYPFVEPGVGIDALCFFCKGKGCKVCGNVGWLEIGGAGMIHPQVLKNGGIDPEVYSGIAWGPGVERIMMVKHGINDVREFLKGDLNFLERF